MALFKNKEKMKDEAAKLNQISADFGQLGSHAEDGADELVTTTLVFHPDWELSNQEKYVYMYQHQQLPLLKKSQLSIKGLKLVSYEDGFVVVAFLRNTLQKAIQFESISIVLLDEQGKSLAKKTFELDTIGELPPTSCMPWRFLFENHDKLVEQIPEEGWTLAFELTQAEDRPHQLDLDESWSNDLTPIQKEHLEQVVAGLPKLGANEVNILGLEAALTPEGGVAVTILLRNGNSKMVQFENLPLVMEDATGEVICQGNFELKLNVKPNSSKPWTFIFPKELLGKEAPDLTSWKVYPPKQ